MSLCSRHAGGPALLLLLAACGKEPAEPASSGDPAPLPLAAIASLASAAPVGPTTYVSLPPGTVPHGATVSIVNLSGGAAVTASLVDGGVDPVSVAAADGDSLRIQATDSAGTTYADVEEVRARRPRVVRTVPAVHKTDVPLNVRIKVVFSEPVTLPSAVGAVRLYNGGSPIPGTITLVEGTPTTIEFAPATDLAATTDYVLQVDATVTDLDGVQLAQSQSLPFRTTGVAGGRPPSPRMVAVTVHLTINDTNTTFITGAQLHIDDGPGVPLSPGASVFYVGPWVQHTFAVSNVSANCMLLGPASRTLEYAPGDSVELLVAVRCVSAGLRLNLVTQLQGGPCGHYLVFAEVKLSRDGVVGEAHRMGLCGSMLLGDVPAGDYVMEVYPVTRTVFGDAVEGFDGCVTLTQVVTFPEEGIVDLPAELDCRNAVHWRRIPP